MKVRISRKVYTFRGEEVVQYINNDGFFNGLYGAMFAQVWDNLGDAESYVRENLDKYIENGQCKVAFEVIF
jgi:hypothetical protein